MNHNNVRVLELGARAFGGNPVGQKAGQGNAAATPQPAGSLSVLSTILDDIDALNAVQQDAITFIEQIA